VTSCDSEGKTKETKRKKLKKKERKKERIKPNIQDEWIKFSL
jgi:hypothetical protein